jgi:cyclopropane-fatty-acyl-phospholipid synthase
LLFLDKEHRAYSQAVFSDDTQSLEDAESNKFDFALQAVQAAPDHHILEIGSGWGSFIEYAGKKGIETTSLTISKSSQSFVQRIIDELHLPCRVLREHFLEHVPAKRYDAIVNCGVTEHLPDYAASLRQYAKLVKPGGYVYLDASADRRKNRQSSFMTKYVFGGNASLLCLHDFLKEVAKSPFQLVGVWNDRHNYYLTTKKWAENLDRNRLEIERKWGKSLYRIFQLYLWGSAEGFHSGMIEAYRVVLQLPHTSE